MVIGTSTAELVDEIDTGLRSQGTPERAEHERAYLKSALEHYGTTVPAIRSAVKAVGAENPDMVHDELVAVVAALWDEPVHERRMAAVELLELNEATPATRRHRPPRAPAA